MNRKQNIFALLTVAAACATMALSAVADDAKPSATGTWSWTQPGRNGGPDRTNTLTLKTDDAKLTGKLSMPGRGGSTTPIETEITDGKVDGDSVSFAIVREYNGNSMTNTYTGKVTADGHHRQNGRHAQWRTHVARLDCQALHGRQVIRQRVSANPNCQFCNELRHLASARWRSVVLESPSYCCTWNCNFTSSQTVLLGKLSRLA